MTLLEWTPAPIPDELDAEADEATRDLCARCREIPFTQLFQPLQHDLAFEHSTASSIVSSARNGCRCCALIEMGLQLQRLVKGDEGDVVGKQMVSMHRTEGDKYDPHQMELRLGGQPQSGSGGLVVKSVPESEPKDMRVIYPRIHPRVDFRFNPLAGLDRARDWLQACLKDHKCRSSAPGLLPSRIIDVCSGSESDIRLLTTTPGTRGCYAALSYCWGAGHDASYLTTTANLQQRQAGFPVDILPRTLRDAVRVTRRLRLRYLWVDAICILQGTDEHARADWTAESGRMADVYSLATVTISATASDHCNGGLAYGMACRVAIGSGKARQLVQLDLTTDGRGYMLEETRGLGARTAIITRAWTLQEHVLSSRILYFTAYGLQWECEGAYVGSPGGRWHTSPKYNLKIFVRKKEPFRRLWADLVANYTLRKLSNSEDKLPAFAAVAKTMHILSGDTYLAGLWKRDLIAHLLWTTKVYGDLRGAQERPVAYRAPSWSWMSLDAAVSLEYKLDQMEVSVIESCHVTPVNPEDPFGQVTGGVLIMRGPTARITRIRGLRIYTNFKQSEYRLGEAVFDTPRDESEARQALEGTTSDIVAIVLQYRRQGNTYALMLAPVTEQGQPTQRYRRIGVVTWFKEVAYARESDWKMEEVPTDKLPVRKFVII